MHSIGCWTEDKIRCGLLLSVGNFLWIGIWIGKILILNNLIELNHNWIELDCICKVSLTSMYFCSFSFIEEYNLVLFFCPPSYTSSYTHSVSISYSTSRNYFVVAPYFQCFFFFLWRMNNRCSSNKNMWLVCLFQGFHLTLSRFDPGGFSWRKCWVGLM